MPIYKYLKYSLKQELHLIKVWFSCNYLDKDYYLINYYWNKERKRKCEQSFPKLWHWKKFANLSPYSFRKNLSENNMQEKAAGITLEKRIFNSILKTHKKRLWWFSFSVKRQTKTWNFAINIYPLQVFSC